MDYDYIIKTDLAIQKKELKLTKSYSHNNIEVKLFKDNNFNYTNVIFNNIETKENKEDLTKILINELNKYLKKYHLKKNCSVMVAGLGNKEIASDSLGVKTIDKVIATAYLPLNYAKKIYTFTPGVLKETGFEAFKAVNALKKELKPDIIIIIDSLISGSVEYLNRLVQITDTGITPGSGLSNYQESISYKTLGLPVIVIGVPTATFASTIIKDALNLESEKITFKKGYDLIVSEKNIDIFVRMMSKLLGEVLNMSLNNISSDQY